MICFFYQFLFFCFLISTSHAEVIRDINVSPNYNYAPHFNPTITPQITNEIQPHIIVNTTSALMVKIGDISLQFVQSIKETMTRENYCSLKSLIKQTLWNYRYAIACGTIMGSYGLTSLLLLADYYHYLQHHTLWAQWKAEYSFEQLCTMPQKELTQELLTAINEHNYNKNNPTDFTHPLTMFLTTIDEEIKICKRYISTTQIIKRLGLIKIFPTSDKKLEEVNNLLQRALFIKHLFLAWLSDYNIINNCKNS
jgi:hypothetical protein